MFSKAHLPPNYEGKLFLRKSGFTNVSDSPLTKTPPHNYLLREGVFTVLLF